MGARLALLEVPFISNQGQVDDAVAYYAQTHVGTVSVTHRGELAYELRKGSERTDNQGALGREVAGAANTCWVLTERMVGGNPCPAAGEASETRVSVFKGGDPAKWKSDIPTFETVQFGMVWPGIEVEARAHGNNVEKVFTINPGAEPESIRLAMDGQAGLYVAEDGSLMVRTESAEARMSAPVAWQENEDGRKVVKVAYRLEKDGSYGFSVGDYDVSRALFIDPILQATYLGTNYQDNIKAMTTNSAGEILVAGSTHDGAFVARLNPELTLLLRVAYIGSAYDVADAITVSDWGVYIAGKTTSSRFPGVGPTSGDSSFGGTEEGFIAWFNDSLTALYRSTYIGGSGSDAVNGIAAYRLTGSIVAVGTTTSRDLPATFDGAMEAYEGGPSDGFAAMFTADLTRLFQSTYIGGENMDECRGVALYDWNGSPYNNRVYVAGTTRSLSFPHYGDRLHGVWHAFVVRLSCGLGEWEEAALVGGNGQNEGAAIVISSTGGIYLAGTTNAQDGFPGTAGSAQPHAGGYGRYDGFLALLSPSLTSVTRATYIGGNADDKVYSIAYQPGAGNIHAGGLTASDDLPGTAGGAQPGLASWPLADAFVTSFNTALTSRIRSTYFGGRYDESDSVLMRAGDSLYMAGSTRSDDLPSTAGGFQPAPPAPLSGTSDGFIARISPDLAGCPSILRHPLSQTILAGNATTLDVVIGSITPVLFQWYRGHAEDTSSPVGSNSPSYTTPPLSETALYWVRVINIYGHTDSVPAMITVVTSCTPPAITTQPQSQTIASGESATLSVVATGAGPLTYQWYRGPAGDTSCPVGTNSDSYPTGSLSSTTQYWVRISNPCGTADSAVATIRVDGGAAGPVITRIKPSQARPGATVTIRLTGHTTDRSRLSVYFGSVRSPRMTSVNRTRIKAVVPAMDAGTVEVYVVSDGLESNRVTFRVVRR